MFCVALQEELAAGGALWFSDLTVPDSTWILPVCLGLTNLIIVEVSLCADGGHLTRSGVTLSMLCLCRCFLCREWGCLACSGWC